MFGDWGWLSDRCEVQQENLDAWLKSIKEKEDTRLVIIEIGAGMFFMLWVFLVGNC